MNFRYKARAADGKIVEGLLEADNQGLALDSLRQKGMLPLSVNQASRAGSAMIANKRTMTIFDKMQRIGTVPAKTKMVFFRQLATMIQAGLSLTMALDIVTEQEKNLIFRDSVNAVKNGIDQGLPMSQVMKQQPVFNSMMTSLVQAGEEGGILEIALTRVANLLEKQQALKGKIKSAMFYPSFLISFAIGVVVVFVAFILPKFKAVFDSMEIELPALTQFLFDMGDYFEHNWRKIGVMVVLGVVALVWLCKSKATKPLMDVVVLKMPVINGLVFKSVMARSMQTLASLVSAGVPILRGLEMASEVAGNSVIKGGFDSLLEAAKRGSNLGDAARGAKIFPVLVCQMVRIGEETGHLDDMLEKVATWYDQELDEQIKAMTSLMEPIMIVFVGGIVAVIAMAIFGPITSAISQMG
ncbi:MAG: type II secretion system F family protein [Synergistaceae bacterium]|jgi:type IV pilus assembly protein PilC|nr:type II secretion system F family protein [Synergistaceae bacterium]